MNIVYVVRNGFYPPFNGERVKSAALATALAASGRLSLIDLGRADYPGDAYPDGATLELPYGGSARCYNMIIHGHATNARRAQAAHGRGEPVRLSRLPLARRRAAARLIAHLRPDVVVADHPLLAQLALGSAARLKVVHAHNVESRLAASMAERSGQLRHRLKVWRLQRIERRVLPRLDQVWAVSEPDAGVFRQLGVQQAVVAPNIIAEQAFAPTAEVGAPGHIAFFGWLAYPPNAAAVEYLLDLLERCPQLTTLTLIGRGLPEALAQRARRNPRVRYLGFVEDLVAATRDAAAIVVPLIHGAGTKLKVLEALALAKPLVTTPVGAEGLDLVDGQHACVREAGPAFDQTVMAVALDPVRFQPMALRGQQRVREQYSQAALNRIVSQALAQGMR